MLKMFWTSKHFKLKKKTSFALLWIITHLSNVCRGDDAQDDILSQKCSSLIPGCLCYDLGQVSEVRCSNASELFKTDHLLDGSIFEVNTTFEITVEGGVTSVPFRGMKGLIVYRLTIDNQDIKDVDEGAFQDVLRLRRFNVRRSSIEKIPDFLSIRDSLRNLNLDNSKLTSLEGDALKNLSLLESVSFFNNSIRQVNQDFFQGTNNIVIFDLSYNEISYLPPHIFDSWTDLRKVALSHNQLFHVNYLFNVARPWFIYLDFNNISDLDSVLDPNMGNLTTLLLAHNPIERVSILSFTRRAPDLRFLYLDHCKIREFDVRHYQSLTILNTLDLSYNEIEFIPQQYIDFGSNLELVLVGNRIQDFHAEMSYSVKRAYLANNRLRELGKTLRFTQLTEVSIANNEIQQLRVEDFHSVHGLCVLGLQNNHIRWIDRLTFSSIRNDLNNLDLSGNFITALNGSVMFLSQLKYLNLTSNFISTFEDGEFTGLNELSELYIDDNRIIALGGQLQQLPRLQFLIVSNNKIQTLKKNQIPNTLQYIYLSDNPIRCDCRLFPFMQWLNSTSSLGTDAPLCVPTPSFMPDEGHLCPPECNCMCTKGTEDYFMSLDCSAKNFSTLPIFLASPHVFVLKDSLSIKTSLRRKSSHSNSITEDEVVITDTVEEIDLSHNNLESLDDACLPSGLRHLYLDNNKLRTLPPDFMSDFPRLKYVSLSENPWKCDCTTIDFRKWILSKMETIRDANNTICRAIDKSENQNLNNKVIWTLDERDLCPTSISFFFSIAFGIIAFFLAVTVSKIVYTKYRTAIKVWLYSKGVTCVKEKDIDKDKRFDAFISFSHKDQDFVINQIISVIEKKQPKIRLCLHYKHFIPGEFITDNIMQAVFNSKRTILILSRNFLESEWCLMEFRAAHVQALKDRVQRIIVIKVGELPKDIDPSIKLYLDNTTYLTWGDKFFWNNLFYVLPHSDLIRSTPIRF